MDVNIVMIKRPISDTLSILCVIALTLTVSSGMMGCATGKEREASQVSYGNPDYRHVKNLPENQVAALGYKDPPSPDLPEMTADEYETLGDALLKKGSLHQAYLQYERSLQRTPDNLRVQYKVGLAFLAGKKAGDARREFQKVIDKKLDFAPAWEGMGRVYLMEKDHPRAEDCFLKAVSLDPRLWQSNNYLGNIYDIRKDHPRAIRHYHSALQLQPQNGSLYNNLGVSYSMDGKFPEAAEAFQAAVALGYTPSKVFNNLAVVMASLGRYDEALEAFKKGVGDARAYNNMGCIYLKAENHAEAIRCFEKAIELDPTYYVKAGENLKLAKKAINGER